MRAEEVFEKLMEEFHRWHEGFTCGFDSHSGHCCGCSPSLYDGEIIIDNRYPSSATEETYEVWERDGTKVIVKDDNSNTVSFIPSQLLQKLGFRLVEKGG